MALLRLKSFPVLKSLFLESNEITKIDGLENCHEIRHLVLDRNRIKDIEPQALLGQWRLEELHIGLLLFNKAPKSLILSFNTKRLMEKLFPSLGRLFLILGILFSAFGIPFLTSKYNHIRWKQTNKPGKFAPFGQPKKTLYRIEPDSGNRPN